LDLARSAGEAALTPAKRGTCAVCNSDEINPPHYIKGGHEVFDFIVDVCRDLPGEEAAMVAPVIKYLSRYRQKHPNPLTDLRKAKWYLNRLINLMIAKEAAGR
jgi:hypothetical protein